jgi:hypothetical protein
MKGKDLATGACLSSEKIARTTVEANEPADAGAKTVKRVLTLARV